MLTIGADIGQKVDPTAIAVAEQQWRTEADRREDYYVIRYLQRLPLGTPYPQVAERLTELVANVRARARADLPAGLSAETYEARAHLTLYVDATGVGQPVVDLLAHVGVTARPVYFTHGDRRTVQHDQSVTLGKAWLVSRLQALLQTGRILLPKTAEADVLARELQTYEIKVDENANEKYGAFKVGTHDDLVTALGLATQPPVISGIADWDAEDLDAEALRRPPPLYGQRRPMQKTDPEILAALQIGSTAPGPAAPQIDFGTAILDENP